MAKTKIEWARLKALPSQRPLPNGKNYFVENEDGSLSLYSVTSDGNPKFIRGISEEDSLKINRLNNDEITKLEGLDTQAEIDDKIQDVEDKIGLASGSVIPIAGTVLPQGASIPSYITTTGKAELQGGSLGKTYTQTGGSPITVGVNNGRYAYYDKETDLWTPGEEYPLPQVEGTDTLEDEGIPKGKAVSRFVNESDSDVLSLSSVIPLPFDKTDIDFNSGNMSITVAYYQKDTFIKKGEEVNDFYCKASANGSVEIRFYTIAGAVATLKHSIVKPVVSGVNVFNKNSLSLPQELSEFDIFPSIRSIESGTLKFTTTIPAEGGSISGTVVTPINIASYPFWITKKHVLDFYPETKKNLSDLQNMIDDTGTVYVPFNKSATTPNVTIPDTDYFGSVSALLKKEQVVQFFNLRNRLAGGSFRIMLAEINGSTLTPFYTSDLITVASIGLNSIDISTISPAFPTSRTKDYYVFVGNDTSVTGAIGFLNSPGNGESYYSYKKDTSILTRTNPPTSSVILSYWLTTQGSIANPLVQSVRDLQSAVKFTGSSVTELLEAFNNNNEVTFSGTITLDRTLEMPANKKLIGSKNSILKLGSGVTQAISVDGVNGVVLDGFTIDGEASQLDIIGTSILPTALDLETLTGLGTKNGILLKRTKGTRVVNVQVKNLTGYGIRLDTIGTDSANGADYLFDYGVDLTDCYAKNCYMGFRAGTNGEYSRFNGLKAIHCIAGISVASGNITVVNGQFENNRVGAHVGAGSNNAHGSFVGGTLNHNKLRGLIVANITNGHVFSGVNFFDGLIELYNSIGVIITGSLIASEILATLNANQGANISSNIFRSDGAYGSGTINKTGLGVLYMSSNTFTTGKDATSINGVR